MNHRKSSRNKRKKPTDDDNNYKVMRVRKVHQTNIPPDAHGTSIYEIDIKSSIEFSANPVAEGASVKLCVANVAPVALKKKTNGIGVDFSVVGNPFIESHYPRFLETETESEGPPPEEPGNTTQPIPIIRQVSDLESSIKPNPLHVEKENNLPEAPESSKTRTHSRRQIFKGYLCKKDSSRPLFCSSSIGSPEDTLLHLHHHEHHHHYHFDPASEGEDTHLHRTCESPESIQGGRKRHCRRRTAFDEENSRHCYHTCGNTANPSPTVTRVVINTQASVPDPNTNLSDSFKTSRSRASSSTESMRVKKSNLIKTHNYSDTELFRCDSDANTTDTFRVDLLRKKDSRTNQSPLVNSLKNFHPLKEASLEAMDQKPNVKSVYIRCKYPVQGISESTVAFTDTEMSSMAKKETEEMVKSDSDSPPFVIKKGEDGTLDVAPIEIWAEKIKGELKEIKKTLRIIEKEFLDRKNLVSMDTNDTVSKSDDEFGSGREISVFSSRTFILRAENFYIIEDSDSGALSEDLDNFLTRNDEVCYAETERGHFFLSPNGSWLHIKNEDRGKKHVWNRIIFSCHRGHGDKLTLNLPTFTSVRERSDDLLKESLQKYIQKDISPDC